MDLTASQALDNAAAILSSLDDESKQARNRAAIARAWLDLARYLREDEHRAAAGVSSPDHRPTHPDMFTG